ncbi:MAG: preprotein translocase subunit SecE [Clostridia bacterium]|nr:preprotein translocase subunit SecE [Clostridia bacterium]
MSDKEKNFTPDTEAGSSDAVKASAMDEKEASKKLAKAAKGTKAKKNEGESAGAKVKKFFKDFKGESKKVVWPDAKTVLKSTGVVLLVVAISTIVIFALDFGLTEGVKGLKKLAADEETTVAEVVEDETTEAEKKEDKEDKEKADKEEETTAAEKETEKAGKETTAAEETTEKAAQ